MINGQLLNTDNMILHKRNIKQRNVQRSSDRTPQEKELAVILSKTINEAMQENDAYKKACLQRVNFDVEIKKNKVFIRCIYLVKENGEVIPHEVNHLLKLTEDDEIEIEEGVPLIRKVGNIMWPRICADSSAEKMIHLLHRGAIAFFAIIFIICSFSMLGRSFLPHPIDTTLFWSSLAAGLGFYVDYIKRGLNHGFK